MRLWVRFLPGAGPFLLLLYVPFVSHFIINWYSVQVSQGGASLLLTNKVNKKAFLAVLLGAKQA